MARQAKCVPCKIYYLWDYPGCKDVPLHKTECPKCGRGPLKRTTHLINLDLYLKVQITDESEVTSKEDRY